jgi:hypothetical protein
MEYLVIGYPHGNGKYLDIGRIKASTKEKALKKFPQSTWCDYFVEEFSEDKYLALKSKLHLEKIVK